MLALVWQCCWEKAKGEAPWQGWGCSKLWAIVWKILRSNGEVYFCETINSAKAGWNAEVEGNGGRHTLPYLHGEGKGSKMANLVFLILSFPLSLSKVGEPAYLIRAQGLHWLLSILSLVIRLFLLTPLLLLSALTNPEESFCVCENAKWMKFVWAVRGVVLLFVWLLCGNFCLLFPFCTQNATAGI